MSIIKAISMVILIISIVLMIYIIADLFIKKSKYKNGKIKNISGTKYIVIILFFMMSFVAYGILRNFI